MTVNSAYRRQLVIDALLRTKTIEDAARVSGISNPTIHRYLTESDFLEQLSKHRRKLFDDAMNVLLVNAESMAQTITSISADTIAPHASRISACRTGLQMLRDNVVLETIEVRVAALEARESTDGEPQWNDGEVDERIQGTDEVAELTLPYALCA